MVKIAINLCDVIFSWKETRYVYNTVERPGLFEEDEPIISQLKEIVIPSKKIAMRVWNGDRIEATRLMIAKYGKPDSIEYCERREIVEVDEIREDVVPVRFLLGYQARR